MRTGHFGGSCRVSDKIRMPSCESILGLLYACQVTCSGTGVEGVKGSGLARCLVWVYVLCSEGSAVTG
jgi:hypothetical protein